MHIRSYRKINYISPRAENFFNNEKNYIWEKLFEFFSIKKWDNEGVWTLLLQVWWNVREFSSASDDEVDLNSFLMRKFRLTKILNLWILLALNHKLIIVHVRRREYFQDVTETSTNYSERKDNDVRSSKTFAFVNLFEHCKLCSIVHLVLCNKHFQLLHSFIRMVWKLYATKKSFCHSSFSHKEFFSSFNCGCTW